MKPLFEVLRIPNYRNLLLAAFSSQMGSVIGLTAFMFYLLDRFSGQPFYATLSELMQSLPALSVFFFVGVLADRMDRQKIAANCDWINAVLSLALLAMVQWDWVPLIFAVLFIRSAVSRFFFPAEQALVQGVLTDKDYSVAAGLNQMMGSLFLLFGTALGAAAYWKLGITGALLLDAVSFAVSGLLIRSCRIGEAVRLPNGRHTWRQLNFRVIVSDFADGLRYILGHKLLAMLVAGFAVFGIINGGMSVMPVFILKYKLAPQTYEEHAVWLGILFGTGLLLGSVAASVLAAKCRPYHLIIGGLVSSGLLLGLSGWVTSIPYFYGLSFIVAFTLPAVNIGLGGWLPRIVDPGRMGRVQGWIGPLMMLTQSVTLGLIALFFPSRIGIEGLFLIVGGCFVVTGLYYLAVLPRQYREDAAVPAAPVPAAEEASSA
ncbi:YkuC [Paenibacillus mucilaginosus 3016]|uniref:YkuC n=1 Tax=Paenibacillus mucilaginosus 3016 TaxID=1116391 RepID=H6NHQ9_9BACL|nr:MFS transporter [Paenibacillus mucilaginosus]AFC30130.1 YkuC [Paenibacillus mucilaginosus 3016]WFA18780.1 MFS transporter [Paenibacillus mucilaginosus]